MDSCLGGFIVDFVEAALENYAEERTYAPCTPTQFVKQRCIPQILPWEDTCHLQTRTDTLPDPPSVPDMALDDGQEAPDSAELDTVVPAESLDTSDRWFLFSSRPSQDGQFIDRSTTISGHLTDVVVREMSCCRPHRLDVFFPETPKIILDAELQDIADRIADPTLPIADTVASVWAAWSDLLSVYTAYSYIASSGLTVYSTVEARVNTYDAMKALVAPDPSPALSLLVTLLARSHFRVEQWMSAAVEATDIAFLQNLVRHVLFFHPVVLNQISIDGEARGMWDDIAPDSPMMLVLRPEEIDVVASHPNPVLRACITLYFAAIADSMASEHSDFAFIGSTAYGLARDTLGAMIAADRSLLIDMYALTAAPDPQTAIIATVTVSELIEAFPEHCLAPDAVHLILQSARTLADEPHGPDMAHRGACCLALCQAVRAARFDVLSTLVDAIGPDAYVQTLFATPVSHGHVAAMLVNLMVDALPALQEVSWKNAASDQRFIALVKICQTGFELTSGDRLMKRPDFQLSLMDLIRDAVSVLHRTHLIRALKADDRGNPTHPTRGRVGSRVGLGGRLGRDRERSLSPGRSRSGSRSVLGRTWAPAGEGRSRSPGHRRTGTPPTLSRSASFGPSSSPLSALHTPSPSVVGSLQQCHDAHSDRSPQARELLMTVVRGGGHLIITPDILVAAIERAAMCDPSAASIVEAVDHLLHMPAVFTQVKRDGRFYAGIIAILGSTGNVAVTSAAWSLLGNLFIQHPLCGDIIKGAGADLIKRIIGQISLSNGTAGALNGLTCLDRVLSMPFSAADRTQAARSVAPLVDVLATPAGWVRIHMVCKRCARRSDQLAVTARRLLATVARGGHMDPLRVMLLAHGEYREAVKPLCDIKM